MKTKMRLNYALMVVMALGLASIFSSCKDDEKVNLPPVITAPGITSVQVNTEVDVTFQFTSEVGYKTAVATATKGDVEIKTPDTANATSGSVVVTFTAGTLIGAGSVEVEITDNDGQTSSATAVIDVTEFPTISVAFNIGENTTWTTGNIYILEGRITVLNGATLTIQPGVIVKGREGAAENATALLVARGGKLEAVGTATQPIIFTSIADQILPGQVESPNISTSTNSLWGGLLVCGKAKISVASDAVTKQIEGIPPSDANGLYGGTDNADNSGTLKYISIRHGGQNIGEGNEINGLTLAGVGSGTVVENIEVVANFDDGIEVFGGAVNIKNAVVWNAGDDAIDTDQDWIGTLDNFIVITPGDKCFELDGPEGSKLNTGNHVLQNGHVKAGNAISIVDVDANSNVNMDDIYFYNIKTPQIVEAAPALYTCLFSDFEVTLPASTTIADFFIGNAAVVTTSVTTPTTGIGADLTKFAGWSLAAIKTAF
jgi:hypothetical protein